VNDLNRQRDRLRRVMASVLGLGGIVTLGAAVLLAASTLDQSVWHAVGVALVPTVVGLTSVIVARRLRRAPGEDDTRS
jgi:hypothetical protein